MRASRKQVSYIIRLAIDCGLADRDGRVERHVPLLARVKPRYRCSWCQRWIRGRWRLWAPISHGICDRCMPSWRTQA